MTTHAVGDSSAVVTGAGGSLGRATALRLASDGYAVALLDLPGEGLAESEAVVKAAGGRAAVQPIDLRDSTALVTAIGAVEDRLGPLQVLVNNAAIYPATP